MNPIAGFVLTPGKPDIYNRYSPKTYATKFLGTPFDIGSENQAETELAVQSEAFRIAIYGGDGAEFLRNEKQSEVLFFLSEKMVNRDATKLLGLAVCLAKHAHIRSELVKIRAKDDMDLVLNGPTLFF